MTAIRMYSERSADWSGPSTARKRCHAPSATPVAESGSRLSAQWRPRPETAAARARVLERSRRSGEPGKSSELACGVGVAHALAPQHGALEEVGDLVAVGCEGHEPITSRPGRAVKRTPDRIPGHTWNSPCIQLVSGAAEQTRP